MTKIDHVTTSNAYLGLKISATGNLNLAVNELKEKEPSMPSKNLSKLKYQ